MKGNHSGLPSFALAVVAAAFSACGGGGGNNEPPVTTNPPSTPQNQGSLAIADVDVDDDGLIEVATLEQLDWMRNDLSGRALVDTAGRVNSKGCLVGGCIGYELTADLNFDTNGDGALDSRDTYFDYDKNGSNAGWRPIGGAGTFVGSGIRFSASFDGNHHRISNLYINRPELDMVGLFGFVMSTNDAALSVQNLIIDGPLTSIVGRNAVGVFIGELVVSAPTVVQNNTVEGKVVGKQLNSGGFIGEVTISDDRLTLQSNYSAASVVGLERSGSLIGALIGHEKGPGGATLSDNGASGDVTVTQYGAGGLVGMMSGIVPLVVEDCYATGKVTGPMDTGGLLGFASGSNVRISRTHATGDVVSEGATGGGLVGSLGSSGDVAVIESWSESNVTATTGGSLGGLVGEVYLGVGSGAGQITLDGTYASGAVTAESSSGSNVGGLIGSVRGDGDAPLSVTSSYATGDVSGNAFVGGIVGGILIEGGAKVVITNVFALGKASAAQVYAGGLLGGGTPGGNAVIAVSNGYSVGAITAGFLPGGLAGIASIFTDSAAAFTFGNSYWATDTTGSLLSIGGIAPFVATSGLHGTTLAGLPVLRARTM